VCNERRDATGRLTESARERGAVAREVESRLNHDRWTYEHDEDHEGAIEASSALNKSAPIPAASK